MNTQLICTSYDCEVMGGLFRFVSFEQFKTTSKQTLSLDWMKQNISKLSAMYNEPRGHPYLLFCVYTIKGDKCEVLTFQPLGHSVQLETISKAASFMLQKTVNPNINFNIEVNGLYTNYSEVDKSMEVQLSSVKLVKETEEMDIYKVDSRLYGFVKTLDLKSMNLQKILGIYDAYQKYHQQNDIENYIYFDSKTHRILVMHRDQIVRVPDSAAYSIIHHRFDNLAILRTMTNRHIKIQDKKFVLEASLSSFSQFYMSETDPFKKGFILQ